MNIQDCRDLVSKFVSSTFDGWPLPRRCGPRFVIPISKTFISIYLSICVFGAGSVSGTSGRPVGPVIDVRTWGRYWKNQSDLS